ncbi:MAG: hypothetical protein ACODAQ_09845 [Phycisphaeraceae bacterium]
MDDKTPQKDEPRLLKRYGDYVILAGLAGFGAVVYLAVAKGFSILLLLMLFYALIVTGVGIGMRVMGRDAL